MFEGNVNNWEIVDIRDAQTKSLTPTHIMVLAQSRKGKSVISEALIYLYYLSGYKIISISDAKDKIELGFCNFLPRENYHIKKNNNKGVPLEAIPIKIYHPFSFNIPQHKIPEINFYTIDIKTLTRGELSLIAETHEDTTPIKMIMGSLDQLRDDEGLKHLIYYAEERAESSENVQGKQLRDLDAKNFFTKGSKGGTGKDVSRAIGYFQPFDKNYCLTPRNCPHNLNMLEVLNDQKHYSIFTQCYLNDPKQKGFIIDNLIHQIMSVCRECKYPLLIYCEEILFLCPKKLKGYTEFLSSDFMKTYIMIGSTAGKGCTTVSTSQIYNSTNDDLIDSMTEMIIGSLSIDDFESIVKKIKLNSEEAKVMRNLKIGEFVIKSMEYNQPFFTTMPPHCHAEVGYNFFEMFEQEHPDKMFSYTPLIEEMELIKKAEDDGVYNMAKKYNDNIYKSAKEKESRKEKKKEKEIDKLMKTKKQKEVLDNQVIKVWFDEYDFGKGKSYYEIAEKHNITLSNGVFDKKKIQRGVMKLFKSMIQDDLAKGISMQDCALKYNLRYEVVESMIEEKEKNEED